MVGDARRASGFGDGYRPRSAGLHGPSVSSRQHPDLLSPWNGYLVFTLEWAVILAIGAFLLQRRDA